MILLRSQLPRINHYKFGQLKIFPALDTDNYTNDQVTQFVNFVNEVSIKRQINYQILQEGCIEVLNSQSLRNNNEVLLAINRAIYIYRSRNSDQNCSFLDEIAQMNQQRLLKPFQEFVYLIYSHDNHTSPQYLINEILLKQELNEEDIFYLKQYKDLDLQIYIDFCLGLPIEGNLNEQYLILQISDLKNKNKLTTLLKQILKQISSLQAHHFKMIFKSVIEYIKGKEFNQEQENINLIKELQQYCYTQIQYKSENIAKYGPQYILSLHKLSTFTDVKYHKVLLDALLQNLERLKNPFFFFQWITLDLIKLSNINALQTIQESIKIDKTYRDHLIQVDLIKALPILVLDNYQLELNQLIEILDHLQKNNPQSVVLNLFVLLFRSPKLLKSLSTLILDRLIEIHNRANIRILNTMYLSVDSVLASKEINYFFKGINFKEDDKTLSNQCRFIYLNKQILEQFPILIKDLGLDRVYNQAFIDNVRMEILKFLSTELKSNILTQYLVSYSVLGDVQDLKIPIENYLNQSKSVHYLRQILKSSIKYRQLLESSEVLDQFRGKDEYIDIFLKETTFDVIQKDVQIDNQKKDQDELKITDNIQTIYDSLMDKNVLKELDLNQIHQYIPKLSLNLHQLSWIKIYNLVNRLNQLNLDDYQLLYKIRQNILLMTKIDLQFIPNLNHILLVYEKVVTIQHHFQEDDFDQVEQKSLQGQFVIETMRRINGKRKLNMDLDNIRLQQFQQLFPYYYEGQKDFIKYFPTNADKLYVAQFLHENNIRFQIDLRNMEAYFKMYSFLSLEKLISLLYLVAQVDKQDTGFIIQRIKQDLDRIQPQLNHLQSHRIVPTMKVLNQLKININKRLSHVIFGSIWKTQSSQILKDILLSEILNIQTLESIEDQLISLE
ncbi:hypothetical protein pb186bvf_002289 [Paramecium bursaria]